MGAFVIAHFEGTIARLVALAALMPMVAGMGGNAGTQALTVTVRSLAAGEITGQCLARDAQGAGGGPPQWRHLPLLGAAVALGSAAPVSPPCSAPRCLQPRRRRLRGTHPARPAALGQDPAVASSVFLTPVTDAVGFLVFLGLATLFLL